MNFKKYNYWWFILFFAVGPLIGLSAAQDSYARSPSTRQIIIDISQQKLFLYRGKRLLKTYAVSTSKYGVGNQALSQKTPLGLHYIVQKIGDGVPMYTVFTRRTPTKTIKKPTANNQGQYITSRILLLKGLEKGKNVGQGVDTFQRKIYIHGTSAEAKIGQPASHGCIRMRNQDIVDLFQRVTVGTQVHLRR